MKNFEGGNYFLNIWKERFKPRRFNRQLVFYSIIIINKFVKAPFLYCVTVETIDDEIAFDKSIFSNTIKL